MAITKNPLIRYKILDQCFRNPWKKFFIEDLIEECNKVLFEIDKKKNGISRRQIMADISYMESVQGWDIELVRHRLGRRVYYRYLDISYSINSIPLNSVEINQLKSAIQILNQFGGMPQFVWMNEILTKLQQGISIDTAEPIIAFDSNQYLKGIENLGMLFNAITYQIPLEIHYKDFKSVKSYILTLHPYYLKQFNNRWFLFGLNPDNNNFVWNLAIDRILSIKDKNVPFIISTVHNWNEYFEDVIGVTKPYGATVENVMLIFRAEAGKYVLNKPLHGSQKSKVLKTGELQIELEIIVNHELESLILSFGNNVKVLSPCFLVSRIRERLINALHWYEG